MVHKIISAAALVFLAGCGTLDGKTALIDPGASKKDVIAVMGAPEDRQFSGPDEAWQYCQTGAGFGYNDHKIIWFSAGQVIGVTSYRTQGPPSCASRFRRINWQDRPDTTIELRRR